ncbi:MAG: radical SAM family heme chaperone HemW [Polyangia bacterium]
MTGPAPFGVYVHFPYCTKRCPYCDFAVSVRRTIPHERYANVVVAELVERAAEFPGRVASSVYFGGGTPGLWRPEALGRVLDAIRSTYALREDAEVTVEVNPGEASAPHLAALRRIGVNRLSIGAQSFDDRSLAVLGRTHDASAARTAVQLARAAGHDNVSVDLIFGLPHASRVALDRELEAVLSLETEHVSLYQLTIEPRTAFAALVRARSLVLPDDEVQAELYERVRERLAQAGYVHHEISSWARPGKHARHNSLYWTQDEYLGVGASASSLRISDGAGERSTNVRSTDAYLSHRHVESTDRLERDAFEREGLWLGLRLVAGIDRAAHHARWGHDPIASDRGSVLQRLVAGGLVVIGDTHLRLTPRGQLLADHVGAELV